MAQYRQPGYDTRFEGNSRTHHDHYINSNGNATDLNHNHVAIGIRGAGGAAGSGVNTHRKQARARRFGAHNKGGKRISIGTCIVVLCLTLALTALAYVYLSADNKVTSNDTFQDDDFKSDFLTNVSRIDKVKFGHGSVSQGRDSRYWDRDDRRRDQDYNEDEVDKGVTGKKDEENEKAHTDIRAINNGKKTSNYNKSIIHRPAVGLYNEAGRNELKMYEEKYEASLKNVGLSGGESQTKNHASDEGMDTDNHEIDVEDEYDDGIDFHDSRNEDYDDNSHNEENSDLPESHSEDGRESHLDGDKRREMAEDSSSDSLEDTYVKAHDSDDANSKSKRTTTKSSPGKKPRKRKHRNTCELKFLDSSSQLVEPLESRKFARFSLRYTDREEKLDGDENWEPRFAGHQSLQEREDSFIAQDKQINCGFVKGPQGYPSTGFDLAEDDLRYFSKCHIAVISCIFGSSDRLRSPTSKAVTRLSRKNVCFVMFMDERSVQTLMADGQVPDRMGFVGFWKIVVVKNLPYPDLRRVGKIPKLLAHRLFPSARYSIWLDSKLRLTRDPLLILEYFLWRKGYEFAISNHYDRHCIWEEVAQNKKLNKYNHTIIDQQFAFYQADGLKRFNVSDPNKLLPSNVPEGSFIIRAHTPMSNLFSCLWFNEVDRFTPRDQLSFAYTYQKLKKKNPGKPFYLHMFKDCERRSIAKLYRHRSEDKRISALEAAL